ncbi:MAG: isoleucine--tRNA ligase [Bacteroidota bacterium]
MLFKELTDKIDYPENEKAVLEFWKAHRIFEKSIALREGGPRFIFYEGPPTANGKPGIHHVMARTLKDLICRYKTMCGYQVPRKAGWDTHGLPVEIEVEKKLGLTHKDEIETFGIEKFNALCRQSVFEYLDDWERMTERIGYWINMKDAYITCSNEYIESVWWALKQFHDRGLIYKSHKIQPYCPRCETPLSSHEVSQGYEDVKDPSIYVKMPVKATEDTSFLVWTTTPWTLISNVALAVHPDVTYVTVLHNGEKLILAKPRLTVLEGEYTVVDERKGSELVGMEYEPLFKFLPVDKKAFYVVEGTFVTTEDGTGIVHIAPAFGDDDYQLGRRYNLPFLQPVDKSGVFTGAVTDYAGMFVKDADSKIIQDLKNRHQLYKKETIVHSYPHCWRCHTPLLYYARESWYIRTTAYVDRMIDLNKRINWIPSEVGSGRFGNWLEENKDWALSRDRYWGTPLNIWICDSCGERLSVSSIEELKIHGAMLPEDLDLHRPFIDRITLTCPKCGGVMHRTPELIDVWFDSGSMPFAQWHYPFEHRDVFEQSYPADFIAEGIDQTRGWFYTLHAIGSFLFDQPAYKNVMVNELILDKEGQKMSKSRGNTVDPFEILERFGADALRWYLTTSSPPWKPTLFDEDGLREVQRKFLGTLVNTYAFFALYANIDNFTYQEDQIPIVNRAELDRWILSELHSLIRRYRKAMDEYDITRAARDVSEFTIERLSNWYVRRSRRRFWSKWSSGDNRRKGDEKLAAYQTLYEILVALTKLIAPFAPFIAETLYQCLNSVTRRDPAESVHLADMPDVDEAIIDTELEKRMERALTIVRLVRALRMKANLKVRQPLPRIVIPIRGFHEQQEIEHVAPLIIDEVNVKAIEYVTEDAPMVRRRAKPNFKSIGPKFGKRAQVVAERIKSLKVDELRAMEKNGSLEVIIQGESVVLAKEDVEIVRDDIEGWLVASENGVTVALDTHLTDDLINEGRARDLVNRIQNMRKDAGFAVTDRIAIFYQTEESLARAIERFAEYLRNETLAQEIAPLQGDTSNLYIASVEIDGIPATIGIQRIR